MTLMKLQNPVLKTAALPLKSGVFSAKELSSSPKNVESRQDDAMLQSSNKRRRYQRRGSKVPSMLMAAFSAHPRQLDEIDLVRIQRRILQDKEFLRRLQLSSETRETPREKCMKRRASLDFLPSSPIANDRPQLR
eukprot:CAMPEP_0119013218 /NCGR_PEP_ID=MMETSP1176-20130426/8190_1 /TAXON_ID=265551 /ORGANISM="Synedropsis recta cf, Strain CCMP1620" /LENGTH=134 /DNA_ID=CAMNT_0006966287 /DNA_START=101 /DNA_END=505 /DNA_ORIENTATION=+